MGRIAVVTDSAAAITPEILKERQERGGFCRGTHAGIRSRDTRTCRHQGHTNRDEYPRFNRS